jgi:hypothetical protein
VKARPSQGFVQRRSTASLVEATLPSASNLPGAEAVNAATAGRAAGRAAIDHPAAKSPRRTRLVVQLVRTAPEDPHRPRVLTISVLRPAVGAVDRVLRVVRGRHRPRVLAPPVPRLAAVAVDFVPRGRHRPRVVVLSLRGVAAMAVNRVPRAVRGLYRPRVVAPSVPRPSAVAVHLVPSVAEGPHLQRLAVPPVQGATAGSRSRARRSVVDPVAAERAELGHGLPSPARSSAAASTWVRGVA